MDAHRAQHPHVERELAGHRSESLSDAMLLQESRRLGLAPRDVVVADLTASASTKHSQAQGFDGRAHDLCNDWVRASRAQNGHPGLRRCRRRASAGACLVHGNWFVTIGRSPFL